MNEGAHQQFYEMFLKIERSLGGIDESLKNMQKEQDLMRTTISNLNEKTIQPMKDDVDTIKNFNSGLKAKVSILSTIFGLVAGAVISTITKLFFMDN